MTLSANYLILQEILAFLNDVELTVQNLIFRRGETDFLDYRLLPDPVKKIIKQKDDMMNNQQKSRYFLQGRQ